MTNIKKASCRIRKAYKGQIARVKMGHHLTRAGGVHMAAFFCKKATGKQDNSVGPQPTTSRCNSDGTRDHRATPLANIHFQNSLGKQHIQYNAAYQ